MSKQRREASTLSRARERLEERAVRLLSGPLGALGDELSSRGWLPPALGGQSSMPISREAHAVRMREVLERDRAMIDAHPEERVAEPVPPFEVRLIAIEARTQGDQSNTVVTRATPMTHVAHEDGLVTSEPSEDSTPSSPVSQGVRQKRVCNEPIRTRTMAKLLLSQGHAERALSIYDALIADGASDPVLLAEADAIRSLQT